MDRTKLADKLKNFRCSFCGREQTETVRLVAGPTHPCCGHNVYICSDYIAQSTEVLRMERNAPLPTISIPG